MGNRVNQDGSAARVPSSSRYFFTSLTPSHSLILTSLTSHSPLTLALSHLHTLSHSHPHSLFSLLPFLSFYRLLLFTSLTCEPLYRFRLLRNRACGLTCVSLCTMV